MVSPPFRIAALPVLITWPSCQRHLNQPARPGQGQERRIGGKLRVQPGFEAQLIPPQATPTAIAARMQRVTISSAFIVLV